jgi:hypothetical protein
MVAVTIPIGHPYPFLLRNRFHYHLIDRTPMYSFSGTAILTLGVFHDPEDIEIIRFERSL